MTDITRRNLIARAGAIAASSALPDAAFAAGPSWQQTLAAAEREGRITLLGPSVEAYRRTISEFQTAYPRIRLEYTAVTSQDVFTRLTNERASNLFLWDIMISGVSGSFFIEQLHRRRWFDPIRPLITVPENLNDASWLGGFNAGFLDKARQYCFAFQVGLQRNTYIDRSKISMKDLSTLADLLNPRWRGKIAMYDPRVRGGGHLLTLIVKALGEAKARLFLTQQRPVLTSNLRQIDEWAVRGIYPITSGMSPSEHALYLQRGIGRNIQPLILPPEQSPWTPGHAVMMRINRAPHPNAAKVFANWMLSRKAQAEWARRGLVNSRRIDVPTGLPSSKIDIEDFRRSFTFNREDNAPFALRAEAIAKSVLG